MRAWHNLRAWDNRCIENEIVATLDDVVDGVIVHDWQEAMTDLTYLVIPKNVIGNDRDARCDYQGVSDDVG